MNLALHKVTYQSSTFGDWYSSNAVDGNIDPVCIIFTSQPHHCSSTNDPAGGPNWLVVDIESPITIDQVILTNDVHYCEYPSYSHCWGCEFESWLCRFGHYMVYMWKLLWHMGSKGSMLYDGASSSLSELLHHCTKSLCLLMKSPNKRMQFGDQKFLNYRIIIVGWSVWTGPSSSVFGNKWWGCSRRSEYAEGDYKIIRLKYYWIENHHMGPVSQHMSIQTTSIRVTAPDYRTRSCIPVSTMRGRSRLRSGTVGQLLTPSIHTETFGSRGFSFSCPTAWNTLPDYLKQMQHVSIFSSEKHLKTYFFKIS